MTIKTEDKGYNPDKDERGFNSYYDDFHFLLGKIVVNINLIESKTMLIICNLTDPENITRGFLDCKKKGATSLLESLKDLIKEKIKNKKILDEFDRLYVDLKKVIEHRNTYIHSLYFDSSNLEIKLNRSKLERVRRIGLREFGKGEKSIQSYIIYELTPLRALVQWLDHLYNELDKFTYLLSKEVTIKQITFTMPEEPEFLTSRSN